MARARLLLAIFCLIQVNLHVFSASTQDYQPHFRMLTDSEPEKIYAEGFCSMYGICAERSDGKPLNCPFNTPSVKPDKLLSSKVQSLCPTITGNVCCTADQFDTLRKQVQQAIPLIVGCPACLRNFLNLFCELSCSPNQSLFINVTSILKVTNTTAVDGIDLYITSTYAEELYNSCKDVKFGTMNSRAMELIGGGAQNYTEWLAFMGKRAGDGEPGSPYAIDFRSNIFASSVIKPLNVTVHPCGDPSLGCSCGDCPSSSVCSESAPPASHKNGSCRIKMGSLEVRCLELSLAIMYIAFICAILLWTLLHRRRVKKDPSSRTNPLVNVRDENELQGADKQENSVQHVQSIHLSETLGEGFDLTHAHAAVRRRSSGVLRLSGVLESQICGGDDSCGGDRLFWKGDDSPSSDTTVEYRWSSLFGSEACSLVTVPSQLCTTKNTKESSLIFSFNHSQRGKGIAQSDEREKLTVGERIEQSSQSTKPLFFFFTLLTVTLTVSLFSHSYSPHKG